MELINKLQKIQDEFGYLPEEELKKLPYPLTQVIGTASFYEFFTFAPVKAPKHIEKLYACKSPGIILNPARPYPWTALEKAKAAPESIIPELKYAKLRGRGGGAFPVGTKWELTLNTQSDVKYVVCNADEGEPGTGKDRVMLENNPNAVLEGMAICAQAVGAEKGIIYLRGEYSDLRGSLEEAIKAAPLDNFTIEVRLGMGAYICGEETALLESIEGKRGEPRLKPPFPGASGIFGRPTVINNVESFACVPYIIENGADEFRKHGTEDYPGTKLYTVSGCVKNPGVYECEAGITVKELLTLAGGATEDLLAVQTGGGSGNIMSLYVLDMPMDIEGCRKYGATLGTGSLRFIGNSECLRTYVKDVTAFYAGESCGYCVPCRVGLGELVKLLGDNETEADRLKSLAKHIQASARCAMGQAAVGPVLSWLEGWC